MGLGAWGKVFGKVADWVPGRKEYRRSKIQVLRKKISELQKKKCFTPDDSAKYVKYTARLRKIQQQIENE